MKKIALLGALFLLLLTSAGSPAFAQNKIIGPKQCSDSNCHQGIYKKSLKHPHETFFNDKYEEKGMKIAGKMNVDDHFEDKKCINCHGSEVASAHPKVPEDDKGLFGIICETCHRPAESWFDVHDKKGRLREAFQLGMRETRNIYQWAQDCFNCHRGVGEDYYNAGHIIGEKFDLVKYSQGDFKHWDWSKKDKAAGGLDQKMAIKLGRIWLAGLAFNIQQSTHHLANAKSGGEFANKNLAILKKNLSQLSAAQGAVGIASIGPIVTTAQGVSDPASAKSAEGALKQHVKTFVQELNTASLAYSQASQLPVPSESDFVRIEK